MKKVVGLILYLLYPLWSMSQYDSLWRQTDILYDMVSHIEDAADLESDEVLTDEFSEMQLFEGQKWSLNDLSSEIALSILKLTDYQFYQLQLYIEKYGELVSMQELLAIDGFDYQDLLRLSPLVDLFRPPKQEKWFKNFFRRAHHGLLLRYAQVLEFQQGYDTSASKGYLGSPSHISFRYQFKTSEHFSLSVAAEKDAGEQFFKGAQKYGFDHYAFSVALKKIGILKSLVVGDFRLNLGQGLVLGSSLMGGKGSSAAIRKFASGVKSVAPMNEGNYFRGVALELGNARASGILFYSNRFYDGKINEDGDFEGAISSSGYHRTALECEKKNVLTSQCVGAEVSLKWRLFRVGLRGLCSWLSKSVVSGKEAYELFELQGLMNCNGSVDYHCLLGKSIWFGEFAVSDGCGLAALHGVQMNFDPKWKSSLLLRYYSPKYKTMYGSGFSGSTNNEAGVYWVSDLIFFRNVTVSVYCDYWACPWLKYRVDAPSTGMECGTKWLCSINRKTTFSIKYKWKNKAVNRSDDYWNELSVNQLHSLRSGLDFQPWQILTLHAELDWQVIIDKKSAYKGQGWLFYQDVQLSFDKIKFKIKGRLAYFDTFSYNERLYAYEDDVLYAFTVNSYYGRGCRYYLMLQYRWKWFDLWFRIAQSRYFDQEQVGSGQTLINGNHKTEIKCQFYFHL